MLNAPFRINARSFDDGDWAQCIICSIFSAFISCCILDYGWIMNWPWWPWWPDSIRNFFFQEDLQLFDVGVRWKLFPNYSFISVLLSLWYRAANFGISWYQKQKWGQHEFAENQNWVIKKLVFASLLAYVIKSWAFIDCNFTTLIE